MENYLAAASPGLQAYVNAYSLEAKDFVDSLSEYPALYKSASLLPSVVGAEAAPVLASSARLRRLAPWVPPTPMFLFVGAAGPGATVRELRFQGRERIGVLLPLEMVLLSSERRTSLSAVGASQLENLSQFAAHELAHIAQISLQGLECYRSLYRDSHKGTNLAYAIREGGADFLGWLASGQLRSRHLHLLQHESALWREFEPQIPMPASDAEWFGSKDRADASRPPQLGYAIGWAICRLYFQSRQCSAQALRAILSAVTADDQLHILLPYAERMKRLAGGVNDWRSVN